jgi:hypothetical protein
MTDPVIQPPLRLGLVFFHRYDEAIMRRLVKSFASGRSPWVVVDAPPIHALFLNCGTRSGDREDIALLRLAVDAERATRRRFGDALPQMALRKPLRPLEVRLVLEMAAASLVPEHVESVLPHTRPGGARDAGPTSRPMPGVTGPVTRSAPAAPRLPTAPQLPVSAQLPVSQQRPVTPRVPAGPGTLREPPHDDPRSTRR